MKTRFYFYIPYIFIFLVIHTPSNDQLNTCTRPDPPPAYESIMMAEIGTEDGPIIMTAPPNYHDISAPLPKYGDSI